MNNNHKPPVRSPADPGLEKHRNPNGTYDGIGVMSDLTSLPRDEIKAIAEQVKANHARLKGCAYHDFAELPDGEGMAGSKPRYRCEHCQGEIDAIAYRWHERGRRPKPAEPSKPYQFTPVPGATCTRELQAAGKPYPRTCQVHGLTCGVKQP